ncbi:unnamed protein product, partial [Clonostachys solani]
RRHWGKYHINGSPSLPRCRLNINPHAMTSWANSGSVRISPRRVSFRQGAGIRPTPGGRKRASSAAMTVTDRHQVLGDLPTYMKQMGPPLPCGSFQLPRSTLFFQTKVNSKRCACSYKSPDLKSIQRQVRHSHDQLWAGNLDKEDGWNSLSSVNRDIQAMNWQDCIRGEATVHAHI